MKFFTEKRLNALAFAIVFILLLFGISNIIKVDYFITAPGVALPLEEIITVETGEKDANGAFYLTAVTSQQANLFYYLYISIFKPRGIEINPKQETMPLDFDMDEYVKIMEDMMYESQILAKIVALRQMGYETHISGSGAEVIEVMESSKAKDILQEGDIIVAIDEEPVNLALEAVDLIQRQEIGDLVKMEVKRDDDLLTLNVPTMEIEENSGKASIGIYIMTYLREIEFPFDVQIDAENIIGPSAGMMFSLEIVNQLHPEDLTHGYKIAGTGTINLDGEVGPIDGITQKIIAAESQGAEYFLAPKENYDEAITVDTTLKVIRIDTFEDAVTFLEELK